MGCAAVEKEKQEAVSGRKILVHFLYVSLIRGTYVTISYMITAQIHNYFFGTHITAWNGVIFAVLFGMLMTVIVELLQLIQALNDEQDLRN